MPRKVMITGGLGFIGSRLARYLSDRGDDVVVVARTKNANFDELDQLTGVKIVIKDMNTLEKSDFADVAQVYHFAGTVHNYNIFNSPFLDCRTNIEGTSKVLELAKELGNVEIILGSTWFVYGRQPTLPVGEEGKCEPLALYGATKLCSEHFVRAYGRVFGLPFKIVRFGNIYGPGDVNSSKEKGALMYLLREIRYNNPIRLYYGGDFVRDYLYVSDAVEGIVHVAANGMPSETYNIGSGVPTKFLDLVKFGLSYFDSKSVVSTIDPPRFHQAVQVKDFYLNIEKAKKIGFAPKVSIEKGLRLACEDIKRQLS